MKGRIRSVPDLARVLNRFGRRSPTLALCAVVLCGLMWEGAGAAPPHRSHPAHRQVRSLASSFPRTEVDQAMGAYVPGVGAVITFQVVRGPNTVRGKSAFDGVLDWLVHIMSTRASKLDAVPADETISLSADFFEYGVEGRRRRRSVALSCMAQRDALRGRSGADLGAAGHRRRCQRIALLGKRLRCIHNALARHWCQR
jgi:hypothetical protein